MPRRALRTLAGATAVTLAASALMLASAVPASADDGTVSGTVFRDFNANGVLDSGAPTGTFDEPLAGVTVTAYDSGSGNWSTTTAADGTYTLNVVGATGSQVRVEFTALPAPYEQGAVSASGADNGTSVQFVDLVAGTGVDFAVNAPEDFNQGDAPLVTAIQWAGSPFTAEGGTKGDEPALAGLAYDNHFTGSQPVGFPGRVTLATFAEVGSVGTNVYHPRSDSLFSAATYKRQSGLGALGLGGIYRVTDVLDANDELQANTGDPWLDVEAIGIDVGNVPSNTARGVSGHQTPTFDPDGFANAGKVGIGGMALSTDGNTLFFVNLFDKRLYALDVSDPDVPPTTFQSFDLGLSDGERPWAVAVYRGQVYVGTVDSGETAAGATPGVAAAAAGLQAHVLAAPLTGLGGAWTEVLTGDLGYTKGDVYNNELAPQSQRWNTWTDTWNWAGGSVGEAGGGWHIYPQPVLSDLYIDEDGYLSLGFTDRTSIQGGNRNRATDASIPGANFEAGASGDLLIASPDGDGTFTLENAGVAGDRTTTTGDVGQGPGNREFYDDSLNLGNGTTHQEVALGNLAGLRGTREVVSTVYDPLNGIRLAGLMWMDVDNGAATGGYELNGDGGPAGAGGNFQKGGGLGGLSLIAAEAPVEVGNRVWFDADRDGIQDPGEAPIPGLTVNLIRGGAVVGTMTTDANGEYYFSSDPESEFFVDDLEPNGGEYTIEFVQPTTGDMFVNDPVHGTVPWSDVQFTSPEATSTETGSNPDPTTGQYTFTVGGPGENDHSIDAGFAPTPVPAVDIEKGDGTGTTIAHDADTMADAEEYEPGETRTVVFTVTNSGTEDLREVTLTDETFSGADVQSLEWTFPDGSTATAVDDNGVLTAEWDDTFGAGTAVWEPGAVITGTATLTVGLDDEPHVNRATVEAVGVETGTEVTDEDAYNAFTGDIQVIKYDGEQPDPAVQNGDGDWIVPAKPLTDAAQDANTPAEAVVYPVNTPQTVRWVVTNTGTTSLTDITLVDVTDDAPAIGGDWTADLSEFGGPANYSFVNDGPWPGILPPGASFFAEGTLTLPPSELHADTVTVTGTIVTPEVDVDGNPTGDPATDPQGEPIVATDDEGDPVTVTDNDPFHARAGIGPFVDIEKGDGAGTTIANDADTMADGQTYTPGESRTIVFTVTNTGDEPLREVALTDETFSGADVIALEWTFPDGSTVAAVEAAGVLTARWDATFDAGTAQWAPGAVITGTATLTVALNDEPHLDRATVTATGALSDIPVTDEDAYNAFTGDIQVIKYDGERPDPAVQDGDGDWIVPAKPLADASQDANTQDEAVVYPVDTPQTVRWVVTNTGTTALTNLTLVDVTDDAPAIGDDWTADLSPFGGPADYSFVTDGPWSGILPAGASFFAEGTLELPPTELHADTVTVTGTIVEPAVDVDGNPTGDPATDPDGDPIVATDDDGNPVTVTDDDPFHARTGIGPFVDIEKGDGAGTTIANDADTMADGEAYLPGETRTIVFTVTNTGDEPLRNVTLTDDALAGPGVVSLEWSFPDGSTATAEDVAGVLTARWDATFDAGTAEWAPDAVITGTATLTIGASDQPHVDRAAVTAAGAQSQIPVSDDDAYNAFTGDVQVIKYDGHGPDPVVHDGTNWVLPAKPLTDAARDANTAAQAVGVKAGASRSVRWVVTNTSTTWLTHLTLVDVTGNGPAIGADWTADLSAFGGPSAYSFVDDGPWEGLLPPGASFFAEGTLTLAAGESHANTVTVTGQVVVPAVDDGGLPTGDPSVDADGNPIVAERDGGPFTVTDDDPYHAKAPGVLAATGAAIGISAGLLAVMLLATGGLMLALRRRQLAERAGV